MNTPLTVTAQTHCGGCGSLLRRTVFPALMAGQADKLMLDCLNDQCERFLVTRDARSYASTDWTRYRQPAKATAHAD